MQTQLKPKRLRSDKIIFMGLWLLLPLAIALVLVVTCTCFLSSLPRTKESAFDVVLYKGAYLMLFVITVVPAALLTFSKLWGRRLPFIGKILLVISWCLMLMCILMYPLLAY